MSKITEQIMNIKLTTLIIGLPLTTTACYPQVKTEPLLPVRIVNTEELELKIENHLKNQPGITIAQRISLVSDGTNSLAENKVKRASVEEIEPLLEIIADQGGELNVSKLCSDSDVASSRIRIKRPPKLESQDLIPLTPPEPEDENLNPFEAQEKAEQKQQEKQAYVQALKENYDIVDRHQNQVKAFQAEQQNQLKQFQEELKRLLAGDASCQTTDIYGGIARVNLLLQEDTSIWGQKTQDWAIFITDGLHNTSRQAVAIDANVKVLLVNGGETTGVFQDINHLRFESPSAAIDYIVHTVNQGK